MCYRFMRQRSEPGTGEDPYAFPPATPGMEGPGHPRMSVADAFNVPPGTPQPVRMPERQMSMPGQLCWVNRKVPEYSKIQT